MVGYIFISLKFFALIQLSIIFILLNLIKSSIFLSIHINMLNHNQWENIERTKGSTIVTANDENVVDIFVIILLFYTF